jgi:ABC-2 type transport system permease protein
MMEHKLGTSIRQVAVMGVAFFSTVSTVWDREFGFLKEVLVAPIPRTAIALGKTAGAATIASVQALILLGLAPVIGVELHPARIPLPILYMLMLSLAVSGLGLLVASLMKTTESFGIVIQILIFLHPLPINGLFLLGFSTVMVLAAVIAFNKRS